MHLRQATADDWQLVRAIRLEALKSDAGVFGASHADAASRDESGWRDWTAGPGKAIFLLHDGDAVIGLTGVYTVADDPASPGRKTAICIASYLQPPFRGRGLSRTFYETRIAWARDNGCHRVVTGHRLSNSASMRANRSFGFQETHRIPRRWPDGVEEPEVLYELRLVSE